MSISRGAVEVLDATDPDATERVCRLVREGSLGLWKLRFWYLCGEYVLLLAVIGAVLFELSWWVVISCATPLGCLAHVVVEWTKLRLRVGIRPGDQWYVLEGPNHRAVALVKTRGGKRFVAGAVGDSLELCRQVSHFSDDWPTGNSHFLTPGLGS